MSVTVEDLLRLPSLRGAELVAGRGAGKKLVSSISVLEYADPNVLQAELFRNNEFFGSEIVITGFLNIPRDVEAQCANLRRLADAGEVGLILFYVGVFMPEVDPKLMALADEKEVHYVDVAEGLMDEEGYLPYEATLDGVHLVPEYCVKWLDYLKTHTAQ